MLLKIQRFSKEILDQAVNAYSKFVGNVQRVATKKGLAYLGIKKKLEKYEDCHKDFCKLIGISKGKINGMIKKKTLKPINITT